MEIINQLLSFFGISNLETISTFAEFVPWFCKFIFAVLIVGTVIRAMISVTYKIRRM